MKRLFAILSTTFFVACSHDPLAGGNGTSTDNVVTARTLPIDSLAASLPDGDAGPYPLFVQIDSSTLDFASSYPDGRDLRVTNDSSMPLPFQLREWNPAQRHASIWVRLPRLERGAKRSIALRIGRDSTVSRSNPFETWKGVSDSTRQNVSSVLLADFETGSLVLGTPCGCNSWYMGHSPKTVIDTPRSGIDSAGKGRSGKAYHLAYKAAVNPDWALVGSRLGDILNHPTHRFGGLDSITFWARGNGTLRIALEDGRDTGTHSKAWRIIDSFPSTTWKRYRVRPSDFEIPTFYSQGWQAVKDRINTITIFGQDGSDFWIDDIRLHGLSPAEIN